MMWVFEYGLFSGNNTRVLIIFNNYERLSVLNINANLDAIADRLYERKIEASPLIARRSLLNVEMEGVEPSSVKLLSLVLHA